MRSPGDRAIPFILTMILNRKIVQYSLIIVALSLFMFSCARNRTVKKTETIMGTNVTITVVAETAKEGEAAIGAAMGEIRRLDEMMSLYKESSEVTRVNMASGKHPVAVSPEMIEVVEGAVAVAKLTDGVFDITMGPLIVLWRMRTAEGDIPTEKEIARILPRVNYRNIIVNKKKSTLFLRRPDMIIDLGGVAKGYAADRAAEILKQHGIGSALVAVAGDIRVLGARPDGSPWRIGVQHPRKPKTTLTVLDLRDTFISTSGDYERFVIKAGKRYHHIIDPRTGKPSTGVISATIIGDRGAIVDPLTTALFVLGRERGMEIVNKLGYEAVVVDEDGRVSHTAGIDVSE